MSWNIFAACLSAARLVSTSEPRISATSSGSVPSTAISSAAAQERVVDLARSRPRERAGLRGGRGRRSRPSSRPVCPGATILAVNARIEVLGQGLRRRASRRRPIAGAERAAEHEDHRRDQDDGHGLPPSMIIDPKMATSARRRRCISAGSISSPADAAARQRNAVPARTGGAWTGAAGRWPARRSRRLRRASPPSRSPARG